MEVKNLRQVLPGLRTAEHIMNIMDEIRVTRLVMPHSRDSLRIYIECPFLIPKKDIYVLEAAIKKQFFDQKEVTIRIIETFRLKDKPLSETLDQYRDSILLELKNYHLIVYNMFRAARIHLEEGEHILVLEAEDSFINRSHSQELCRVLEKILVERM